MQSQKTEDTSYDYVIIGSGFGGSVSALRLSQKGYKVLVIEKGRWFKDSTYAKSAWNVSKWLWLPMLGLRGIFRLEPLKHVTVLHGVGVGGGSLTYGATLPTPKPSFFKTGSWAKLQNWEEKLKPYYDEALRMLGATTNPSMTDADNVIQELSERIGKEDNFHPSRVGIFFSDNDQKGNFVKDPYFDGEGPDRKGCIECASCMTGCRHNAKNTLDKNYLYLAQKHGTEIIAERQVTDVAPISSKDGSEGYFITFKNSNPYGKKNLQVVRAKGVIFSAGVMGTIPLLLDLKSRNSSLPRLSDKVGEDIRTNNETVTAITSSRENVDFAKGVTIGSIVDTDEHSHVEPISYNNNAGLMKLFHAPNVSGSNILLRLLSFLKILLSEPKKHLSILFNKNWGRQTITLLFMQTLDSTINFKKGFGGRLASTLSDGPAPSRHIPESASITKEVEDIVDGKATTGITEALFGTPTTAHILGGAVMGSSADEGVINDKNEVFGYENMYVCDGSAVSANPGVNPSLSITAITECAMSQIPAKAENTGEAVVTKIETPKKASA